MLRALLALLTLAVMVGVVEAGPFNRRSPRAACVGGSCSDVTAETVLVAAPAPKPLAQAALASAPKPLAEAVARIRDRRDFRFLRPIWWLLHPGWFR